MTCRVAARRSDPRRETLPVKRTSGAASRRTNERAKKHERNVGEVGIRRLDRLPVQCTTVRSRYAPNCCLLQCRR